MAKVSSKNMFYVLGSILIIILIVMTLNSRGKKQTSGRTMLPLLYFLVLLIHLILLL